MNNFVGLTDKEAKYLSELISTAESDASDDEIEEVSDKYGSESNIEVMEEMSRDVASAIAVHIRMAS